MKYNIWTFGCQMNKSDSQRIAKVLEKIGYQPVRKNEEADLIIVNACSVRQSAIDRIYGQANYFKELKKSNQNLITILTGCILEKDKKQMAKNFDLTIDINKISQLPNLLGKRKNDGLKNYFYIQPKYNSKIEAYVPIMTGCNNFCSYCVVPYVRGREISRPEKEIIAEIKGLTKKGYKKILLLGQNVNSYNNNLKVESLKLKVKNKNTKTKDFIALIEKINRIPGKFWFSFITNHPKDMTDKLIKTLPKLEKFSHYIHLPCQSGNNEILKKMNRHYTASKYLSLVNKIRKALPDVTISTDIIIGFPGETRKQFSDTTNLMEKVKYDMAYLNIYSPRSQTRAYGLKDSVPKKEKVQREKTLNKILTRTAYQNNKNYLGKKIEVLVKSKNAKKADYFFGETKTSKNVDFKARKNLLGKFIKLKITKATPWGLQGEIV